MKFKFIAAIAFCAMAIMSCDEDTTTIGGSLINDNDKLVVSTKNFNVQTGSVLVDSVYTRERQCYLGNVKDPETNTYIKSLFTAQFYLMEDIQRELPELDSLISKVDGQPVASSCTLQIFFDTKSSYGDTLTAMKLKVSELDRPIEGADIHYTNFSPRDNGFIRNGGYEVNQMFTLRDLTASDSIRNLIKTNLTTSSDNGYYDMLSVSLDAPYTDKSGKVYNNYGTYLFRNFYEHPEYFKNSYTFMHHLCPGFQFETTDGLGVMARIQEVDMLVHYSCYISGDTVDTYLRMTSTEEVLQTNQVINDRKALQTLVDDNSCTYLKTPSGIYTEAILPVDEICASHTSDSLLSAKVIFNRLNNQSEAKELAFNTPSKLLLIEKDSLKHFIEGNNLANNTYAYKTTLVSNAYTFSNISNLITRMYHQKADGLKADPNWVAHHPNWNKVLLVPIDEVTINQASSTSTTAVSLRNQLGLSSTRLVKGTAEKPITIEVIYAKFQD